MPNPLLGVFFHWLGGLTSGSFYVPFRGVRRWSWETAWLVGGVMSWIIAPWLFALALCPHLLSILQDGFHDHPKDMAWVFFYGILWGFGGLTFGLAVRYMGMSLGMAMVLGYCAAFGTLLPPIYQGTFHQTLIARVSGNWTLVGIGVCLIGIAFAGVAGVWKERKLARQAQPVGQSHVHYLRGYLIAAFSGVMSACFSFGLTAGEPLATLTKQYLHDAHTQWDGLPTLIVLLTGGFLTNAVWCVILNTMNRSGGEYVGRASAHTADSPDGEPAPYDRTPIPMARNYALSSLAGLTWYLQFFFYTIGASMMGAYGFSSWTLHMASIIIFSSLWGIVLMEWKGGGRKAFAMLLIALCFLVTSTVVIGYGNYLGVKADAAAAAAAEHGPGPTTVPAPATPAR